MTSAGTKVVVIGGDAVIGAALEALLESAGYRVQYLPEFRMNKLGASLADAQLLIVAPALSVERWQAALKLTLSSPSATIPVLQMLPTNGKEQRIRGYAVPWPCGVEELRRAIDHVLLAQQ